MPVPQITLEAGTSQAEYRLDVERNDEPDEMARSYNGATAGEDAQLRSLNLFDATRRKHLTGRRCDLLEDGSRCVG
jgi:hypothetical protein